MATLPNIGPTLLSQGCSTSGPGAGLTIRVPGPRSALAAVQAGRSVAARPDGLRAGFAGRHSCCWAMQRVSAGLGSLARGRAYGRGLRRSMAT